MEQSKTIIRLSRSKNIEASAYAAILALDNFQNIIGQPVMVRYWKDSTHTTIDAVLAIGVNNGTGRESYKIIYSGALETLVNGVWTEEGQAPDVSLLAHGELYIVKDGNGVWCYCYAVNDVRQIEPITGGPYTYIDISDNSTWYFSEGELSQGGGSGGGGTFASGQKVSETTISDSVADISSTSTDLLQGKAIYQYIENRLSGNLPFNVTASFSPSGGTYLPGETTPNITATVSAKKVTTTNPGGVDVTSATSFKYNTGSGWVSVTLNANYQCTIPGVTKSTTGNVGCQIQGTHPTYGTKTSSSATYSFKLPFLVKVDYLYEYDSSDGKLYYTDPEDGQRKEVLLSSFTTTDLTFKPQPPSYREQRYTVTSTNKFPVFCVPEEWGTISSVKVTPGGDSYDSWHQVGNRLYERSITRGSVSSKVWYRVYQKGGDGSVYSNYPFYFYF